MLIMTRTARVATTTVKANVAAAIAAAESKEVAAKPKPVLRHKLAALLNSLSMAHHFDTRADANITARAWWRLRPAGARAQIQHLPRTIHPPSRSTPVHTPVLIKLTLPERILVGRKKVQKTGRTADQTGGSTRTPRVNTDGKV
ncbi:hypothetical protein K438DRAFT_1960912 [Mycena galopus ATCC 62051]|nr:hypothetical protein K438DRAFT_1960912 [Mycena galopus ATCC 62051]